MAHVIHSINVTASGLCHHLDSAVDDAHHQYAIELTRSADAMVLGRNTFDLFMEFWPGAVGNKDLPENTIALANAFNTIQKFVVSSRPVDTRWNNTQHLPGPDLKQLQQTLAQLQGNAVIFGSPGLAASMINNGLIDELHILGQPFIGVDGPRVFAGINQQIKLNLIETTTFPSGVVFSRYNTF